MNLNKLLFKRALITGEKMRSTLDCTFILFFFSCFHISVIFLSAFLPAAILPPFTINFFFQLFPAVKSLIPWFSFHPVRCSFWVVYTSADFVNAMIQLTEVACLLKLELIIIFNIAIILGCSWERVDWGKCLLT